MKNIFSVAGAAIRNPEGLALRTPEGDYSYSELASLVFKRAGGLRLPPAGRPYILQASSDFETLLTVYALLELQVPILPLHPALTPAELATLMEIVRSNAEPLPPDAALVVFTSGTTGRPKPAVISNRALAASAGSCAAGIRQTPDDVWLLPLSLARIGGFSIITRSIAAGSAVAIGGRFTAEGFMDSLLSMRATLASIVPTMLAKILDDCPGVRPPESFRLALVGGAPLSRSLRTAAVEAGWPTVSTYGMTETASNIAASPYNLRLEGDVDFFLANPGVEMRSNRGQIEVRTPSLMDGYWGGQPVEGNSWFATGDLGQVDPDGRWRFQARRSDLIVTGGDNVYPLEVEQALRGLSWVSSALVLGVPDAVWGSVVTALLVPEPGTEIPEPEVFAGAVRERLSPFKCPRLVAWVETLPTGPAGKPCRNPSVLDGIRLTRLHYSACA